ncbi:MAG: tyrosine-type recombinase/integrase [Clostridia bacterium]|nr:tyrosine-type recombinase/integrase [Clostridia bacterium]
MSNYFKDRDKDNTRRLIELREQLPDFCEEFFIGIEPQTTTLTRLGYAYDLRIFFDYLMKRVEAFRLKKDVKNISVYDLDALTVYHLEGFLEYLTYYEFDGKEYSNNERGKARKISTVRTLFKYFYAKDKLKQNVASKVKVPKLHDKDIIRLEANEVGKILDAAEDCDGVSDHQRKILRNTRARDVAILTLLLGTGIRVSECVGLNISDIDFNTNGFTITRKGGNQAILYFGDEVREALKYYIDGERKALISRSERINIQDDNALFLSLQIKRISVRAVENLVKKYASIASPLKKISPHKLRSTYGTNLYKATGDIYMVADVLGHKDVNTTKKHYAAITEDHRKMAAKAVTLRDNDTKAKHTDDFDTDEQNP